MFSKIRRTKMQMSGRSLVKFTVTRAFVALLLGLAILAFLPTKASAASTPACHVETLCTSINQAQLNGFIPQLEISDTTLVHTGPGINYYIYGDLPAGFTSPVIGVSADGKWWAIPLPLTIAADGLGWIPAAAVFAKNTQRMPDWLAHCDRMTYCGYVLAHSPQYVPVVQASSTAPMFGIAAP